MAQEEGRLSVFIIAEAGVNHNGDADRALAMVDAAAAAGADAVKFQTFSADKLAAPGAEKAEYQKRETGDGDQHAMLKALEMSDDLHRRLIARCADRGVEFMSTPFDEEAADLLDGLGMVRIKVPSGEIVNHPFLRHLASKNRPLIVSTGLATMQEIEEALAVIAAARPAHGFAAPITWTLTVLPFTPTSPPAASDCINCINCIIRRYSNNINIRRFCSATNVAYHHSRGPDSRAGKGRWRGYDHRQGTRAAAATSSNNTAAESWK